MCTEFYVLRTLKRAGVLYRAHLELAPIGSVVECKTGAGSSIIRGVVEASRCDIKVIPLALLLSRPVLAYGEEAAWLRSVLAESRTTIKTKGEIYGVVEPELIAASEVLPLLPAWARLLMRM